GAASTVAAIRWSRAVVRLSVLARTRAIWACAAEMDWAWTAWPPPAIAVRASSATPNLALRATGLSLRAGGLDVRADLELGLEQRPAGVVQGLGRVPVGGPHR